jgi:hypothetical protein
MTSATVEINSLLVGLPRPLLTVFPKYFEIVPRSARSHAVDIAWRIARSTHEAVVPYSFATLG